jgi:hypothetical protein
VSEGPVTVEKYDAATLTIGDLTLPAKDISVERTFDPRVHAPPRGVLTAEFHAEMTVDMPTFCAAFESLLPREATQPVATGYRGNASTASLFTLAKRMSYGGRKGCRAVHRVYEGQWGPTAVIIAPYGQRVFGFDLQTVEETRR